MGGKKASKAKTGEKKKGGGGFMTFMNEIRPKIKEEYPDMKPMEISKEGGKEWRALSEKKNRSTKIKAGNLKKNKLIWFLNSKEI
jgi:hypothetical protein